MKNFRVLLFLPHPVHAAFNPPRWLTMSGRGGSLRETKTSLAAGERRTDFLRSKMMNGAASVTSPGTDGEQQPNASAPAAATKSSPFTFSMPPTSSDTQHKKAMIQSPVLPSLPRTPTYAMSKTTNSTTHEADSLTYDQLLRQFNEVPIIVDIITVLSFYKSVVGSDFF